MMRLLCYFALLAGSAQAATTYYVCTATGSPCNASDANAGTSKTATWLHAPGMPSATGTPAAYSPTSGDSFIFRGGDTWHFGNSGATPYVGIMTNCVGSVSCGWVVPDFGSGSAYFGVDQTWYNSGVCGGAWCRPILNGDNPLSTSAVGSCTYDESNEYMTVAGSRRNITYDNFEYKGLCWTGPTTPIQALWVGSSIATTNNIFENLYFHGWTHTAFNCSGGGTCVASSGILGATDRTLAVGDQFIGIVVDGSDSDPTSGFGIFGGGYDIHNSVFRYICNAVITNGTHVFHDNLIEYIVSCGDSVAHSNGFEFNTEYIGTNAIYNNIIRHMWLSGTANEVTAWEVSHSLDYVFNNLVYDTPYNVNYWNLVSGAQGYGETGSVTLFNNTFILPANTPAIAGSDTSTTGNYYNNHCTTPSGGSANACFFAGAGTQNYATNLLQSTAVAAGQGYTSSETYAYSPASGSGGTVGAGTNETALCTALATAGLSDAATACQLDTGYACAYNTSTHSVSCPARTRVARPSIIVWDVGIYQSGIGIGMGLNIGIGLNIGWK